jgi:hypothetical protein
LSRNASARPSDTVRRATANAPATMLLKLRDVFTKTPLRKVIPRTAYSHDGEK